MIELCNVCKACKKSDLIITDGDCGGTNCGPGNSFKDFVAKDRDTKTLLDEFAMAVVANGTMLSEIVNATNNPMTAHDVAKNAYTIAAAMMKERNLYNDDGTLKEEATE